MKDKAGSVTKRIFDDPKVDLSEEFNELDRKEFLGLTAYVLEHYGGMAAQDYLLKSASRVVHFSEEDLTEIVMLMDYSPPLGVDAIIQFYGSYTMIPIEAFGFLSALGFEPSKCYSAGYFTSESRAAHSDPTRHVRRFYLDRLEVPRPLVEALRAKTVLAPTR